jgi:hypothetical protein
MPRFTRKLAAITITGAAVLAAGAGPALAADAGVASAPRAKAPAPGDFPTNQALITVQFKNGKVTGVTGTAVPSSQRVSPGASPGGTSYRCAVNFTNSKKRVGTQTEAKWFGGIGCNVAPFIFGESYLLETATKLDGTGAHYQGTMRSASSGNNKTTINSRNPSLYIRHLTNVYYPSGNSGQISVFPAAGQKLNKASKCSPVRTPAYAVGVQCDLYSNRF